MRWTSRGSRDEDTRLAPWDALRWRIRAGRLGPDLRTGAFRAVVELVTGERFTSKRNRLKPELLELGGIRADD
jgi:hypothetical protein